MQTKKGIAVSPGVAIATAFVLDASVSRVPRRTIARSQIEGELKRLREALEKAEKDIRTQRDQAAAKLGEDLARIFDAHVTMCRDKHLVSQYEATIRQERVTAEYAVSTVLSREAEKIRGLDNAYFRERVNDIYDLQQRILAPLIGDVQGQLDRLTQPAIVVAHDLTPTQTAALDKDKIRGLATDAGGRTSHTAIMAHALGIPAVVGLETLSHDVETGDTVIIDGNQGEVIVNPDAAVLLEYRQYIQRLERFEDSLGELATLPAVTRDGTPITLQANIEFPYEIGPALAKGATGIGLYRTEFLYLASEGDPTEEDHYNAYVEAIRHLDGRVLTIRTLDLGADKFSDHGVLVGDPAERNPFLGCRSIRLCLQHLPLFRTQLRAILRASAEGPVRIMFPLISSIMELRQAKMVLQDVMEDMEEQGEPFAEKIPVGIMIEVPSAALQAKGLAREADFFSIGTNDLIQYTLAVDRSNERIASLYSGAHPAVLQLIKDVVRTANRSKVDVSLCGEMAGEPEFIMLLVGLGLRTLSIVPPALPEVKNIIRAVTVDHCQKIARKATTFDSDRQVLNYLRDELRKVIPEVADGRSIAV